MRVYNTDSLCSVEYEQVEIKNTGLKLVPERFGHVSVRYLMLESDISQYIWN